MRSTLILAFCLLQLLLKAQSDTLFYWNNVAKPCNITFITEDDILFKTVEFTKEQTVSKKQIQAYFRDGKFYLFKNGFFIKQDTAFYFTSKDYQIDGTSGQNLNSDFKNGPIFHARNCQVAGAAFMFIGFSTQYVISLSKPDFTKSGTVKTFRTISQVSAALIVLGAGLELNGIALMRKNTKRTSMLMGVGTEGFFCALKF